VIRVDAPNLESGLVAFVPTADGLVIEIGGLVGSVPLEVTIRLTIRELDRWGRLCRAARDGESPKGVYLCPRKPPARPGGGDR
jgi:hypothetical protein